MISLTSTFPDRSLQGILLCLLIGGLIGCNNAIQNNLTQINQLQESSEAGKEVYVQGQVSDPVSLLDTGAYQLQDSTGNIWVFTNETLPNEGDEVTIKGQVKYESISVGDFELGEVYLLELEQVKRRASSSSLQPLKGIILPSESYGQ